MYFIQSLPDAQGGVWCATKHPGNMVIFLKALCDSLMFSKGWQSFTIIAEPFKQLIEIQSKNNMQKRASRHTAVNAAGAILLLLLDTLCLQKGSQSNIC